MLLPNQVEVLLQSLEPQVRTSTPQVSRLSAVSKVLPGEAKGMRQPLPRQVSLEDLKALPWMGRESRMLRLGREHTGKLMRR